MSVDRLSASAQTLYVELLELEQIAAAVAATGVAGSGSFVSKRIKGNTYWYLQRSEGAKKRQLYLGPDSPALNAWMDESRAARANRRGGEVTRRSLCAMLQAGGATSESAAVLKVLQTLAEAGVYRLGGVIVGTLAFRAIANVLGVQFRGAALRTEDVDVAHDPRIGVALASEVTRGDLPRRLGKMEPPFLPVPGLDPRHPSATFIVRRRQLRVDFLTPARGKSEGPVALHDFGCAAQPLPFLEYLLEGTIEAVVIGSSSVLGNLPQPARFAFHKLFTAASRGVAMQTKVAKDLAQAAALIEVLLDDRPGDLDLAWSAVASRKVRATMIAATRAIEPSLRRRLGDLIGDFAPTPNVGR